MGSLKITQKEARGLWMKSSGLFGSKPTQNILKDLTQIVRQLGYIQIDTIHVIERAHHHILWSRYPQYRPEHLVQLQSAEKNIFEYWTHALAYILVEDYKYFVPCMKKFSRSPGRWMANVTPDQRKNLLKRIKLHGAISITDIKDDVLVEKDHEWASRKPSKRALQYLFNAGDLTISRREGMRKYYELSKRHFQWAKRPVAATDIEVLNYKIERAFRCQGLITLDSVAYLEPSLKKEVHAQLKRMEAAEKIQSVQIEELPGISFWMKSDAQVLSKKEWEGLDQIHILSPFDPLIIQRKRLNHLFGYQHLFEAYIPPAKRKFGYFGLPILKGDQVISVIDFKTDRTNQKLLIQKWSWLGKYKSKSLKSEIEDKIDQFEKFQLGK